MDPNVNYPTDDQLSVIAKLMIKRKSSLIIKNYKDIFNDNREGYVYTILLTLRLQDNCSAFRKMSSEFEFCIVYCVKILNQHSLDRINESTKTKRLIIREAFKVFWIAAGIRGCPQIIESCIRHGFIKYARAEIMFNSHIYKLQQFYVHTLAVASVGPAADILRQCFLLLFPQYFRLDISIYDGLTKGGKILIQYIREFEIYRSRVIAILGLQKKSRLVKGQKDVISLIAKLVWGRRLIERVSTLAQTATQSSAVGYCVTF